MKLRYPLLGFVLAQAEQGAHRLARDVTMLGKGFESLSPVARQSLPPCFLVVCKLFPGRHLGSWQ